ncbi:MAG: MaoC family dehydratase N-terminal domain-containing protein [Actinomycetota bacterium]|nr:MaoC family dehydratase N-terminal domain-containing protein [Actinomycetota bacterium]
MALPIDSLGTRYEAPAVTVDRDRAMAYAAATNDTNPAYESGQFAPPVFGVVPTWSLLQRAVADAVPAERRPLMVHGEQDLFFHQPLAPGMRVAGSAVVHSVRVGPSGTRCTIRTMTREQGSGRLVGEQYATMFVRGMSDGHSGGLDKPAHTFPEGARDHRVGQGAVRVDRDQTFRYRDASGDGTAIHVDDAAARGVGLPGVVVHGLCTMAMTGRVVLAVVADGDPGRLRRLAARFSGFVLPGSDVVTTIHRVASGVGSDAGAAPLRQVYAFEAHSDGRLVVANGRAEVEA